MDNEKSVIGLLLISPAENSPYPTSIHKASNNKNYSAYKARSVVDRLLLELKFTGSIGRLGI
ncbi:hypothetical protein ACX02_14650 [Vibrio parahaemolyticus]|nr:hypothetical protein ACX02_14650 [Vibrio parahaemolyticus]